MNTVSIWWHALGTCAVVISVLAKAKTHQSAGFVFTRFVDNTGDPGWGTRAGNAYVAIIGILMAQYTMTGETKSFFHILPMTEARRVRCECTCKIRLQ